MFINLLVVALIQVFTTFGIPSEPEFKGGQESLAKFIIANLIYPEYAKQNCLQGTIYVGFKLNKKGRIFGSAIKKGFGIDLDDEALRLVRLTSGKWIVPPSYDTTSLMILPVNFALKEYECEKRPPDNINVAISEYRARKSLINVIFNFYEKKAKGIKFNNSEELHILNLKTQLGYNDQYINHLLKQANRKVKQGDSESACDDYLTIQGLGSSKADKLIEHNCR